MTRLFSCVYTIIHRNKEKTHPGCPWKKQGHLMNPPADSHEHRFLDILGEFHKHKIGIFDGCIYVVLDSSVGTFSYFL